MLIFVDLTNQTIFMHLAGVGILLYPNIVLSPSYIINLYCIASLKKINSIKIGCHILYVRKRELLCDVIPISLLI